MPVTTVNETIKQKEYEAAYEQWVQAELSSDPSLTAYRILYNDLREYGQVLPETWAYFDLQEQTGGAESINTQHITFLTGEYDPKTDEIVAAIAGGERITYDAITINGVERAQKRVAANSDFAFQLERDQIYHNNYHGVVKEMWRGNTDYDTVIYVSTFPQDVIDDFGNYGHHLLQQLHYDPEESKGFINIFRKNSHTGKPEYAAVRIGNALPEYMAKYLQTRGKKVGKLSSHQYGGQVITAHTADRAFVDVATGEVDVFDEVLRKETGKNHRFGLDKPGIDAYELFKQCPNIWGAYRQYHELLARHFAGAPLAPDLYDYLVNTHAAVGFHVLDAHDSARLGAQLDAQKITADMALACKKVTTYAHYATLKRLLDEYRTTGRIIDIKGEELMQAYGATAGGDGGQAAQRGDILGDCETVYGQVVNSAAALAAREGISLEEAMRRLNRKPERWTDGQCRNCERETKIWKLEDGGCNICKTCADADTLKKEAGLREERQKAQAERKRDLEKHAHIYQAAETEKAEAPKDEIAVGATRVVKGQRQVRIRWIGTGSATNMWVDAATGRPISFDENKAS